jgi:predicted ATPase/DNA-binding winged helix-turn-helix (wHTH) protein
MTNTLDLGHCLVDFDRAQVDHADGRRFTLTDLEMQLLRYLYAQRPRIVPPKELLREVWGYSDKAQTRAAAQAVYRLRRKVERNAQEPEMLLSTYGLGYRFAVPEPTEEAVDYFGRQDELRRVSAHLAEQGGLLTLVGPAGVGKTRLAREGARSSGSRWIWVDLADVAQGGVVSAVVQALELPDANEDKLAEALRARAKEPLILDNAEHLADEVAGFLRRLFPGVDRAVLVTSRRLLGLPFEQTLAVPPLSSVEASELFLHHAQRRDADYDPDDALTALVARLDGLPLALELAARRASLLSPQQLLAQLERRPLQVLTGGEAGRSSGVRQALQCSWDLLGAPQRAVLAALASTPGRLGFEELLAVVEDDVDLLAVLQELAELHLVIAGTDGDFELLVSVRSFTLATLGGTDLEVVATVAELLTADWDLSDPLASEHEDLQPVLFRIATRLPAVVAGVEAALERGDVELAARCASAAAKVFQRRGPLERGAELVRTVLRHDPSPSARARLLLDRARITELAGDVHRSLDDLQEVAADAPIGLVRGAAHLRLGCGSMSSQDFDAAARAFDAAAASSDSPTLRVMVDFNRSVLGWYTSGDVAAYRSRERRLARRLHDLGMPRLEAASRINCAGMCLVGGDVAEAARRYQQAMRVLERIGDQRNTAIVHTSLAHVALLQGRIADALEGYAKGAELHADLGDFVWAAVAAGHHATTRWRGERGERGTPLSDELGGRFAHALAELERGGAQRQEAALQVSLAEAYLHAGDLTAASGALERARERATGAEALRVTVDGLSAWVAVLGGEDPARERVLEAAERLRELGAETMLRHLRARAALAATRRRLTWRDDPGVPLSA